MRRLLEWCRKRGIEVINGPYASYNWDGKRKWIQLPPARPETRLFLLLHECGHHLLRKSGEERGVDWAARNLETKIAYVNNEIAAWQRGLRLAHRLGIRINKKRWSCVRKRNLATYLRWAGK